MKSISEISPAWKSLFLPQRINPIIFSRSIQDQEPTKKPLEGKDFQNGQFHLSEYHRLLLEACQFARYTSEHPLEKWTVCSLPNVYKLPIRVCTVPFPTQFNRLPSFANALRAFVFFRATQLRRSLELKLCNQIRNQSPSLALLNNLFMEVP